MTTSEVPLIPSTNQTFSISLAGVSYGCSVHWCNPAQCWLLDLYDASGNAILTGVPLVTGADLLAQYAYLGIGGQLTASTDFNAGAVPTFDNLGVSGHLRFTAP